MKNISVLFEQLKRYVATLSWVFAVFETIAALVFGALLGAQFSGEKLWGALLGVGAAYLVLLVVKFRTQRLFPSAVVDELQSRQLLVDAREQLARRDVVSRFITDSITALNAQTCAITSEAQDDLCSEAVATGLNRVLGSLVSSPQYLFNCSESRFSVAALVSYNDGSEAGWAEEFIVLRDDLELAGFLSPDIMYTHQATGGYLDLQKMLQRCFNENVFVCESFKPSDESIAIAACPIPLVCEVKDASGILLFASPCGHSCPPDVDNTLRIFGRIVANWLFKYSECAATKGLARRRAAALQSLETPSSERASETGQVGDAEETDPP